MLGRGTTVIDTEDGGLGDYLESLERLRGLGTGRCCPGTGPTSTTWRRSPRCTLTHREERLDQVRAALRELGADATARAVVEHVYTDVDEKLWDLRRMESVQAQLDYLRPSALVCELLAPARSVARPYRARRARRSESEISTLLPSSRSHPR